MESEFYFIGSGDEHDKELDNEVGAENDADLMQTHVAAAEAVPTTVEGEVQASANEGEAELLPSTDEWEAPTQEVKEMMQAMGFESLDVDLLRDLLRQSGG